jgi:GxxExxY protein
MDVAGMKINDVTGVVVNAAMKVHTALGPGLLERTYQTCLAHELRKRGLVVETEVPMPVVYDGVVTELGYRLDLLVESEVVVEVKAVSQLLPVHRHQLLTQLKFSKKSVGLLFNFHEHHLKDRIVRYANNLKE